MRKSIEIKMDKQRELRYNTNALIILEDLMGKSITSLDFNNIGMKDLRMLLYAGLKHEDKSLTLDYTGDLMDDCDLEYTVQKIAEAFTASFGKGNNKNMGK